MWALGCILYELAALDVPFKAQNIPVLIRKITSSRLPAMPPQFSAELRQLCQQLLCRDYNLRPSAVEILQGPMIQAEMRQMLQDAPLKGDPSGKSLDLERRRMLAPLQGPVNQAEMRHMLQDGPMKADPSASPPLSIVKTVEPERKRTLAPLQVLMAHAERCDRPSTKEMRQILQDGPIKADPSPSPEPKPFTSGKAVEPERRKRGSFLKPLDENMVTKRSPSAPLPSPAGKKKGLRQSGSDALISSTGAVKTAWADPPPKEGALGCDIPCGNLDLKQASKLGLKQACINPLLHPMGATRCGSNRGHRHHSRRRPALPVWQDIR